MSLRTIAHFDFVTQDDSEGCEIVWSRCEKDYNTSWYIRVGLPAFRKKEEAHQAWKFMPSVTTRAVHIVSGIKIRWGSGKDDRAGFIVSLPPGCLRWYV